MPDVTNLVSLSSFSCM